MKIIGQSATGYMVDMTADEIARAMGYPYCHDASFREATASAWTGSSYDRERSLKIGSVFLLTERSNHLRKVLETEAAARNSSATLRALAGLLDQGLPSAVVLPEIPEEHSNT